MNTFFSALASSTGGLISVIAAFLISKILSKEEVFLSLDEELDLTLITAKKFKNRFENINMSYYIKETRKDGAKDLKEDIRSISYDELKDRSVYFDKYYSQFDKFDEVEEDITKLIEWKKSSDFNNISKRLEGLIKEDAPHFKTVEEYLNQIEFPISFKARLMSKTHKILSEYKYSPVIGLNLFAKIYGMGSILEGMNYCTPSDIRGKGFYKIRDDYHELRIEADEFINKTKLITNKIKGFSKQRKEINIFSLLIFLFFIIGMIYPLSFLKYGDNVNLDYSLYRNFMEEVSSVSGKVLFLISSVFFGFIGRIIYINNKLVFKKSKLEEVNNVSKYGYYSVYLQNYYENTKE